MTIKSKNRFRYDIQEYQFGKFDDSVIDDEIQEFDINEIDNKKIVDAERNSFNPDVEYANENKTGFKIEEIVREHRDVLKFEQMKLDQRVDQLAEKQVSSIKDQAYKVGEEEGKKRAYSDALLEYQDNFNKNIMKIEKFVQEINNEKNNVLESFRANLLNLITSTTKWVIINEIKKDEKAYIERLLEKMILEVDSFQNLLIKIDKKSFEGYEELLAETENKVGKLKNIRVEVFSQTNYPGIIVESDKTILDGTIEAQFEKINKLAENVFERDN